MPFAGTDLMRPDEDVTMPHGVVNCVVSIPPNRCTRRMSAPFVPGITALSVNSDGESGRAEAIAANPKAKATTVRKPTLALT
jgi:hypothetical protein